MTTTTTRERALQMSAAMVRARREGRKDQTRRLMNPQPPEDAGELLCGLYHPTKVDRYGEEFPGTEVFGAYDGNGEWGCVSRWKPGDRFYITEHWRAPAEYDHLPPRDIPEGADIWYEADGVSTETGWGRFRHGRYMMRWMSRDRGVIEWVRPERLQDISEEDAQAEGVEPYRCPHADAMMNAVGGGMKPIPYTSGFANLWNEINGPCSWTANSWVWAIGLGRADE